MEPRIDLSSLDPESDPDRLDRVVTGVLQRLGPGLVPQEPPLTTEIAQILAGRFRPLFAAASVVALVAAWMLLGRVRSEVPTRPAAVPGVALPAAWNAWLSADRPQTAEELLLYFAGGDR